MTPLELADYLDNNVEAMLHTEQKYIDKAAMMLRTLEGEKEVLSDIILSLESAIDNAKAALRGV